MSINAVETPFSTSKGLSSDLELHCGSSLSSPAESFVAEGKPSFGQQIAEPSTREIGRALAPDGGVRSGFSSVSRLRSQYPNLNEVILARKGSNEASIVSLFSPNGTPRSSGDSHIMSTSSTDTLMSEYPNTNFGRPSQIGRYDHDLPLPKTAQASTPTELLMMGYGQVSGYFTLDGSLIKQQSFEPLKQKRVIGSQRGREVIQAEKSKTQSGLFNTLRWSNLGESITEILGGDEPSSIKNAKDSASVRSIPILSTPQSVLFVDLKLEPGQSITYIYRCPLPSAIPPTHKGRAMKVYYHLTIGIQRAANTVPKEQISIIDVPFRVVTGLNGETSFLKIAYSS